MALPKGKKIPYGECKRMTKKFPMSTDTLISLIDNDDRV
jgi:hypothetical protein